MIRVCAISYLNTIPYLYGLLHSEVRKQIEIHVDYPAECAHKLASNEADIAIVPIAAIPSLGNCHIFTDYCIGSEGVVRTVSLLSQCPLSEIRNIYLDYQSRTSVNLVKVLCTRFWKIAPQWQKLKPEQDIKAFTSTNAVVIIGDRVFEAEKHYKYNYDLSLEWRNFTGLPFVFAVWVSNKTLNSDFINLFNSALNYGVNSISLAVSELYKNPLVSAIEAQRYLTKNISYALTEQKQLAMDLFFKYLREYSLI